MPSEPTPRRAHRSLQNVYVVYEPRIRRRGRRRAKAARARRTGRRDSGEPGEDTLTAEGELERSLMRQTATAPAKRDTPPRDTPFKLSVGDGRERQAEHGRRRVAHQAVRIATG